MSLSDDMTGVALLADWLGDGGSPVHDMVAAFRAERCLEGDNGRPCSLNTSPNWWERVKSTIADWIRGELVVKDGLNLHVMGEDRLHMCKACGCCLRLKVWTPKEHLQKHISKSMLSKTPEWCWMRKELL